MVVHHRTPGPLLTLLASLRGFDEVIVVDSASADGTVETVAARHPTVTVVPLPVNRGFAAGANAGIRMSSTDLAVLIGSDSEAPAALASHLESAATARPNLWIGGCRLEATDGSAQLNGRRFYTPLTLLGRRLHPRSRSFRRHSLGHWDRTTDRPVDWVSGNGMVIRRSAFDQLGGFDERFFMYFEDVDVCLRAWRGGGEVWFLAGASLTHHEQRASARGVNRALWWHVQSYGRFLRKWGATGLRPPPYGDRCAEVRSILPDT